jgi:hypothetical protein
VSGEAVGCRWKDVFQEGAVDVSCEGLTKKRLERQRNGHAEGVTMMAKSARGKGLEVGSLQEFFIRGDENQTSDVSRGRDEAVCGISVKIFGPLISTEGNLSGQR